MPVLIVIFVALFFISLLISSMIHQERIRLWREYQVGLEDKKKAEMEEQKRKATDKIKVMLRDKRRAVTPEAVQPRAGQPPAPGGGGAETPDQPAEASASSR